MLLLYQVFIFLSLEEVNEEIQHSLLGASVSHKLLLSLIVEIKESQYVSHNELEHRKECASIFKLYE